MNRWRRQIEFRGLGGMKREEKVDIVVSESANDFTPKSTWDRDDSTPVEDVKRSRTFEKPKAVSSSRKRDAVASWAIYHLPPLAVTTVLTVMYVQQWTWPYPGPSDEVMAVLQFPAKVHECLIVASLSNIIFHRLRYLLIKSDHGVPLGLVTTPFQLNNPLYYVGPEFLGALRRLLSSVSIFLTFGLVLIIALLSLAASPLSAVLLIPRRLVFPIPASHPVMQGLINRNFLIDPPDGDGTYLADTLILPGDRQFPLSFSSELGASWTCPSLGNMQGHCVSFFQDLFPDIVSVAVGANNDDFVPLDPDPLNVTVGGAKLRLRVNNLQIDSEEVGLLNSSSSGLTRATCPLRISTPTLFGVQQMIRNNPNVTGTDTISSLYWSARNKTQPSLQPQILAHSCFGMVTTSKISLEYLISAGWDEPTEDFSSPFTENYSNCFATGWFPGFEFRMTETLATQLLRQNWATGFLLFVDIQDQVPFPISGAYISVGTKELSTQVDQRMEIVYFVASWAPASPTSIRYFDQVSNSPITAGELRTPLNNLLNQTPPPSNSVVRMDANWLNTLDIFPFELVPTDRGFPRLTNNSISLFTHITQTTNTMPSLLAAIMAAAHGVFGALPPGPSMCVSPNGKACYRGPDDGSRKRAIEYDLAQNVTGPARDLVQNQLQARVKVEQVAFGYKFEGTTIKFAFAFLYLHALLVVGHLVAMFAGGVWSSSAWGNLTDFVVLGLGSSPSEVLRNAGAGVRTWRTWAYMASVRNTEEEPRLELVVFDDKKGDGWQLRGKVKPKRDVKYS